MRPTLLAALVVALVPLGAFAQSGPYLAVVSDIEVKLRAGPSDRMPETGTLKKGDVVVVHEEENGWLAVQDSPGRLQSVSWVQTQFVNVNPQKTTPQNVVVEDGTTRGRRNRFAADDAYSPHEGPSGTILTVTA